MTLKEFADKLVAAKGDRRCSSRLSSYAIESIETGRSSYPASNLIEYCKSFGLALVMVDMATEERYFAISVMDIHANLSMLMNRYDVDCQLVYRKTGVHYTMPKTFDGDQPAPLSIKTILAVCDVIHCDLQVIQIPTDDKQCS